MKNSVNIYFILAFCLVVTGCSLSMRNQTPETFPWIKYENNPIESPDLFMYENTFLRLVTLNDEDPGHTFNLEVYPKNVTNVNCYVVVNGEEHLMQQDQEYSRLYTWTPDIPLGVPAEYYFRASYKRGLYGYTTQNLGSEEEPFRAEPVGHGYAVEIVPNQIAIPFDQAANLMPSAYFINPSEAPLNIIVQSLHPDQVRVAQVEFIDIPAEGTNHNNYFEFINLPAEAMDPAYIPSNGVVLNFGEKLPFQVGLIPEGSVFVEEHGTAWCFISMIIADDSGMRNEHLRVQADKEPL